MKLKFEIRVWYYCSISSKVFKSTQSVQKYSKVFKNLTDSWIFYFLHKCKDLQDINGINFWSMTFLEEVLFLFKFSSSQMPLLSECFLSLVWYVLATAILQWFIYEYINEKYICNIIDKHYFFRCRL